MTILSEHDRVSVGTFPRSYQGNDEYMPKEVWRTGIKKIKSLYTLSKKFVIIIFLKY